MDFNGYVLCDYEIRVNDRFIMIMFERNIYAGRPFCAGYDIFSPYSFNLYKTDGHGVLFSDSQDGYEKADYPQEFSEAVREWIHAYYVINKAEIEAKRKRFIEDCLHYAEIRLQDAESELAEAAEELSKLKFRLSTSPKEPQ